MTSPPSRPRTAALLLGTAALVAPLAALHSAAAPASAAGDPAAAASPHLDLGPADLPESRTTTRLQPGVTLTRITRGGDDPSLHWTLEALVPATSTSPDPDAPPRSVTDRASADAETDRLRSKGFPARVEEVDQPATADVPAGVLGYRVRVGSYPTQQDADADKARLAAAGESASSVFTGWDGSASDRGPWHVDVVRIDPQAFRGGLQASYGPDLHDRETTSALAQAAGATVGVNGGFFVMDPASGAPGDPAGIGVYGGRVLSEPTNGRAALVLHADGGRTSVDRVRWAGHLSVDGKDLPLDGTNRVPGLIRNCGGDASDQPTSQPLHDTTCTDDSELVSFNRAYGPTTPSGDGREVLLDARHRVRQVLDHRGTTLPAGYTSVQATGAKADELASVKVGETMTVSPSLRGADGASYRPSASTTLVNGGPVLVRAGHEDITQKQDGFVHPGDPSFAYGWVLKRNPRTFAGVDAQGRTVIVTVDGRTTRDLGLSVPEEADVARSLGLRDAINLDGGGSTTLAVDGKVVSHPSDATGERPVGDALLVTPSR
ncbi:MAG: phosphodiester glycosidase family protein [Nocardioidaceae bacterium]